MDLLYAQSNLVNDAFGPLFLRVNGPMRHAHPMHKLCTIHAQSHTQWAKVNRSARRISRLGNSPVDVGKRSRTDENLSWASVADGGLQIVAFDWLTLR
jgi:hypothetical protein